MRLVPSGKLKVFGFAAFIAVVLLACTTHSVIYEKLSPHGAIVVTEDDRGLRTLLLDNSGARQSVVKPDDPGHLELAYTRVAMLALAICEEPSRILVVGLGGGTLPMFLRKHYPDATISVVEINPDVVDVAKRFFGFREDAHLRVHVGDGRHFIENIRLLPYDIIFLDAFGAESIPAHLATQEFLQAVRRAVAPGGVVVGNVWRGSHNRLYDPMVRTYQEVFDELFIAEVAGDVNNMLFALPRRQLLNQSELAIAARKVSELRRFPFDLGRLAEASFYHAREKKQETSVLRDADLGQAK